MDNMRRPTTIIRNWIIGVGRRLFIANNSAGYTPEKLVILGYFPKMGRIIGVRRTDCLFGDESPILSKKLCNLYHKRYVERCVWSDTV